MKTLADLKRRLACGDRLQCVANTLRPVLDGDVRTVTKVQTNGFWWTSPLTTRGRAWTDFPAAKDVTWIDNDTVQLGLGKTLDGTVHYTQLRFVQTSTQETV